MKKLLELIQIKNEVRDLLDEQIQLPTGMFICLHLNLYTDTTISIYKDSTSDATSKTLKHNGIVFSIEDTIDKQIVDDVISQLERLCNENSSTMEAS